MIAVIPTLQTASRLRSGTARAVAVLWLVVSSLAAAFPGWTVLRGEVVEDVAVWGLARHRGARFVAQRAW